MELKTLLLNSTLIFLNNFEYFKNDSDLPVKYRLPKYIKPIDYNIHLIQRNDSSFYGNCNITIMIDHSTYSISFHVQIPQVNLKYISLKNPFSSRTYIPEKYTYYIESHILDVYFANMLFAGFYTVNMEFIITPDNDGQGLFEIVYINKKKKTMSLFATQFHAIGARQIFPCWDEPAFTAIFNISIKHYSAYTALSNMPIRDIKIEKGKMLTYFEETPIMSTYLIVIILRSDDSPYVFSDGINSWYHTQQLTYVRYINFAIRIADNVTKYLKSGIFGSIWKRFIMFSNVNHIVIPSFPHDSTTNLKLIFYRDSVITYDDTLDPAAHKLNVASVVARAIVQESFATLFPFWWSYAWINEGISILLAVDTINKIYPDFRMLDMFVVQIQQESLHLHIDSIMKPLTSKVNSPSEINSLFSFAYYMKAPAVLRMLQHLLTNEVFWNSIAQFLRNNWPRPAKPNDLWTVMQVALNESSNKNKFHIKETMNPWTQLKHYPVLEVKQHNSSHMRISLENYDSLNEKTLWIPVTGIILEDINVTDISFPDSIAWLSPERDKQDIFISYDYFNNPIIINYQQTGYYRVNYSPENWRKIAKYLNTTKYTKIHVLSRAQIIDDAFYFLMKDQLDLSIFLELAKYLKQETDYVAWYPMIKALEYMSCFFLFDESAYIKAYMRDILSRLLTKIGYIEQPNDNDLLKCLRQEAVRWACIFGDDICKKNAVDKLKWHLENFEKNKFLPSWKEWTYYNGLMASDLMADNIWPRVFIIWLKTCDNKLLELLFCSASPFNFSYLANAVNISKELDKCYFAVLGKHVNTYIDYIINAPVNSYLLSIAKHANNKTLHENLLGTLPFGTKPKEVSIGAILVVIVNHVYSEEQIDQVTEFVDYYFKRIKFVFISRLQRINDIFLSQKKVREGIKNYLERVISLIQDKIKKRAIEIAKQRSIFKILHKNKTNKIEL